MQRSRTQKRSHSTPDGGLQPTLTPEEAPVSNSEQQEILAQAGPEDALEGSLLQRILGSEPRERVTDDTAPEEVLDGSLVQTILGSQPRNKVTDNTAPEDVLDGSILQKPLGAPVKVREETGDPLEDGSLGFFLNSTYNAQDMLAIEEDKSLDEDGKKTQRTLALNRMIQEGTVAPGEVRSVYQSSWDKGLDFGAENELLGIWDSDYVLHGHYHDNGAVSPGSLGLKLRSDKYGPRLNVHSGIDDALSPDTSDLSTKWHASPEYQKALQKPQNPPKKKKKKSTPNKNNKTNQSGGNNRNGGGNNRYRGGNNRNGGGRYRKKTT